LGGVCPGPGPGPAVDQLLGAVPRGQQEGLWLPGNDQGGCRLARVHYLWLHARDLRPNGVIVRCRRNTHGLGSKAMVITRQGANVTFEVGPFRYEALAQWEQLPSGWSFVEVAGVATDSQDRVYVFCRGEHPVLVFDRGGKLLTSWGEGQFQRAHGIFI